VCVDCVINGLKLLVECLAFFLVVQCYAMLLFREHELLTYTIVEISTDSLAIIIIFVLHTYSLGVYVGSE
jgi:hypothetical protein